LRTIFAERLDAGVTGLEVFTVCTADEGIASYAAYERAGETAGPSTWPIFADSPEAGVWAKECASSYVLAILDGAGVVVYHAVTNLTVVEQRDAFTTALDLELGIP
jgi:hypothetical protein